MSENLIIGVVLIFGAYLTLLFYVVSASKKVDEYSDENSSSENDRGNTKG